MCRRRRRRRTAAAAAASVCIFIFIFFFCAAFLPSLVLTYKVIIVCNSSPYRKNSIFFLYIMLTTYNIFICERINYRYHFTVLEHPQTVNKNPLPGTRNTHREFD
ncbi:ORF1048 [White spot syndrome virus]|uniref:Wsv253 n=3 Tax=White spot syndrome virus TaxID=342409 RepID=Q8VAX0_WSSVS|nr:wsv253 [Shrimp white spot syndrome virus]AFX59627.1 wsv253 [White spot syndrome virus]AAL33256.1 wsv253 [Shrimp white spot syndrome virus]AAL89176.1 WSSV308 [Shrimp white spot syndrome virus]ATU83630.1 ORF1048 [White spot syndrome virus]AWQ60830.1 wsv253 [Shrimp white spot syndrome virus]